MPQTKPKPKPRPVQAAKPAKGPDTFDIALYVMVDSFGSFAVAPTEKQATQDFDEVIGSIAPRRMLKVVLSVPKMEACTLQGVVPAMGDAKLKVG